jgi:hypothetical protein
MPADFLRLSRLLEKLHTSLTGVTSDQHHARQHALNAGADHTGRAALSQMPEINDGVIDYSLGVTARVNGTYTLVNQAGAGSVYIKLGGDGSAGASHDTQIVTDGVQVKEVDANVVYEGCLLFLNSIVVRYVEAGGGGDQPSTEIHGNYGT